MIEDFLNNAQKFRDMEWPSQTQFNVLVNTVFDVSCLKNISIPFSITIFLFSEKDYMQFSSMFEAFSTDHNIWFVPLYNNENLSFFETDVFMEKTDLDKIDLSKNEIFIRQTLNMNDFGKLVIMPNEIVYANPNTPPLGSIDDSPYSIVYKEFMEGESWFKIRDQAPCTECIYQWLCPTPSNYETVIGRPNLCHIDQL